MTRTRSDRPFPLFQEEGEAQVSKALAQQKKQLTGLPARITVTPQAVCPRHA